MTVHIQFPARFKKIILEIYVWYEHAYCPKSTNDLKSWLVALDHAFIIKQ